MNRQNKKRGDRETGGRWLRWGLLLLLCSGFALAGSLAVAMERPEGWHRLRTNSVPYRPLTVFLDAAGGLWVSAVDGSEYEPGLWYRPTGGDFQYWTPAHRNNAVGEGANPPVVKPELTAPVLHALRDKAGNTWYALKNRKVLCEKADKTWVTFNMPDSSNIQPGTDTTNVDSAHRIRLLDKADGSQEVLLIANRGVLRINASMAIVETRRVYFEYNNYFIRDALIDSKGRYWVTSEMGLEKGTSLSNTIYVKDLYPENPSAPGATTKISRIVEDSRGNLWFGTDFGYGNEGIFCFTNGDVWTKYADGVVNDIGKRVHDMVSTADGSVWFGACYSGNGGLVRYIPNESGGQWVRYRNADLGTQSEEITSLAADSQGGIWFVTAYYPGVTGNGTGVHYLALDEQAKPQAVHYTYRSSSTTLTSLRYSYIAADRKGGVWFAAYDDPSIARLKADGTWQQIRQTGASVNLGSFGFAGVAGDSKNRIYFASTNAPPLAYDAAAEQWLTLPPIPYTEFYYYGVYVDPQDGVWFHGAYGAYYLDPASSGWIRYSQAEVPQLPDYRVDGVLVDDGGNIWFMSWGGIALGKKDPQGGALTWLAFKAGDASGYTGGYRVYQDDNGQVWSADKKKFDPQTNTWSAAADTSAFDRRSLRFLNGRVKADMPLTGALEPVQRLDERLMTLDTRGTIYFTGGLGDVRAGIVALWTLNGDLDRNQRVDLADAILAVRVPADLPSSAEAGDDIDGDGRIGLAEVIYILQRTAGLR